MSTFPTRLLAGYRHARDARDPDEQARARRLANEGQQPEVMMISCCDSRVAPEAVFGSAPGELFVVRNVANLVPPPTPDGAHRATSAALEFAILGLGVRHIVVLGHSHCGGVRAALEALPPLSPDNFVGQWMAAARPAIEAVCAASEDGPAGPERLRALEHASVRHSVANLRAYPFVATAENEGRLHLHGAWIDIAEGELRIMDPATGKFSPPA